MPSASPKERKTSAVSRTKSAVKQDKADEKKGKDDKKEPKLDVSTVTVPYFGKRKQVTYHPNLSYGCFHILPTVLFFQAKYYA